MGGESISVKLRLSLDSDSVRYTLLEATSQMQDDARSAILRRSSQPHLDAMHEVVESAIRELPPFPATGRKIEFTIPYSFTLK